jgi:hypothetical protein
MLKLSFHGGQPDPQKEENENFVKIMHIISHANV